MVDQGHYAPIPWLKRGREALFFQTRKKKKIRWISIYGSFDKNPSEHVASTSWVRRRPLDEVTVQVSGPTVGCSIYNNKFGEFPYMVIFVGTQGCTGPAPHGWRGGTSTTVLSTFQPQIRAAASITINSGNFHIGSFSWEHGGARVQHFLGKEEVPLQRCCPSFRPNGPLLRACRIFRGLPPPSAVEKKRALQDPLSR
jgi:hypothetical protein